MFQITLMIVLALELKHLYISRQPINSFIISNQFGLKIGTMNYFEENLQCSSFQKLVIVNQNLFYKVIHNSNIIVFYNTVHWLVNRFPPDNSTNT